MPGSLLVNLSQQQPATCAPGTGPKLLRRSATPQDVPGEPPCGTHMGLALRPRIKCCLCPVPNALTYQAGKSSARHVRWVLLAMRNSKECLRDAARCAQARMGSRMEVSLGRALQMLGHPRPATSPCPPSSESAPPH